MASALTSAPSSYRRWTPISYLPPRRSDTGGGSQDELQAMESVMPGWCDFYARLPHRALYAVPREEVISNSYAALSLMVACSRTYCRSSFA